MSEKELLKWAAKAAGLVVIDADGLGLRIESEGCKTGYMWNPLTDDGDALRLAVKLNLLADIKYICNNYQDEYAVVRRAIARAAAEIGKEMP